MDWNNELNDDDDNDVFDNDVFDNDDLFDHDLFDHDDNLFGHVNDPPNDDNVNKPPQLRIDTSRPKTQQGDNALPIFTTPPTP